MLLGNDTSFTLLLTEESLNSGLNFLVFQYHIAPSSQFGRIYLFVTLTNFPIKRKWEMEEALEGFKHLNVAEEGICY